MSLPGARAAEPRTFLYINNNDFENSVSGFRVNDDGSLVRLPGSPYLTGGSGGRRPAVGGITVAKKPRLLFATNNRDNSVTGFRINTDGSLTRLGSPAATGGLYASGVAVNKQGTRLFVANIDSDSIASFTVENGQIRPVSGSPFRAGNGPIDLVLNKPASILFASHQFSHGIGVYSIDASGRLQFNNEAITLGLLNHGLTLDLATERIYVSELGNNSISGYRVNTQTGALTVLPNTPYFTDGSRPIGVTTTRDGRFIFVSNNNNSSITVFTVNSDGSLRAITGSPFTTDGQGPAGMVTNKKSTLLFVVNGGQGGSNDVSVYRIAASGALTPVPRSPFPLGTVGTPSALALLELSVN